MTISEKKTEMESLQSYQLKWDNAAVCIMGLTKARVRTPTLSLASVHAVKCLGLFFLVEVELQLKW